MFCVGRKVCKHNLSIGINQDLTEIQLCRNTVNSLNIRTLKRFVVITLKFELCGSTIE